MSAKFHLLVRPDMKYGQKVGPAMFHLFSEIWQGLERDQNAWVKAQLPLGQIHPF